MSDDQRPKRKIDYTNRIARLAIAEAIERFSKWRTDVARFEALSTECMVRASVPRWWLDALQSRRRCKTRELPSSVPLLELRRTLEWPMSG